MSSSDWKSCVRRISRVMYDADPDGMGSTVFAPDDEYDDIAIDLMRAMRDKPADITFADAVLLKWPMLESEAAIEIGKLWSDYAASLGDSQVSDRSLGHRPDLLERLDDRQLQVVLARRVHGDYVHLATLIDRVRPASYTEKVIGYLLDRGYRLSPSNPILLPPG